MEPVFASAQASLIKLQRGQIRFKEEIKMSDVDPSLAPFL